MNKISDYVIAGVAIISITLIELYAIKNGLNGFSLRVCLISIAFITGLLFNPDEVLKIIKSKIKGR